MLYWVAGAGRTVTGGYVSPSGDASRRVAPEKSFACAGGQRVRRCAGKSLDLGWGEYAWSSAEHLDFRRASTMELQEIVYVRELLATR